MYEVLVDVQVEAPQALSLAPTSDGTQAQVREKVEEHLKEHELHQEEAVQQEVLGVLDKETKCLKVLEILDVLDLFALLLKDHSRAQGGCKHVKALTAKIATGSLRREQ